jgi:hypothetical protein
MLTINHIEANGHQSIRQAKWVSYDPDTKQLTAGNAIMDVKTEEQHHDTFANGRIYVMNENGKTVATYNLS